MCLVIEHLALLTVHLIYGTENPDISWLEAVFLPIIVVYKEFRYATKIGVEIVKHRRHGGTNKLAALLLALDKLKIEFPGILVTCLDAGHSNTGAYLGCYIVYGLAAVMDEVNINRISDLGIGIGGINLEHSLMELSLAVRILGIIGALGICRGSTLTLGVIVVS